MTFGNVVRLVLTCGLLAPFAAGAGDVVIVDPAGGEGVFLSPQAAVNFTSPGDVVLIKGSEFYDTLTISGKGITVVGDGGVPGFTDIRVEDIPVGQTATVRGIRASGNLFDENTPFVVRDSPGCVVLEDLQISKVAIGANVANPSLTVLNSDRVLVIRCTITGRAGAGTSDPYFGVQGGCGLATGSSSVAVYDSVIRGGDGGDGAVIIFGSVVNSTFGGTGAQITDGPVFFSGCTIIGGEGGTGAETAPGLCDIENSSGADGIRVFPSGDILVLDCAITAGLAGIVPAGCTSTANDGDVIDLNAGSVTTIDDTARSFSLSSPVREGESVAVSASGEDGEFAFLLVSGLCFGAPFGNLTGSLMPQAPFTVVPLGPLVGGELDLSVPVPANLLPAGCEAVDVYAQMAVPGGVLSSGSVLTVLAAGL